MDLVCFRTFQESEKKMQEETDPHGEIEISFGYQCNNTKIGIPEDSVPDGREVLAGFRLHKTSSFSCLSGAALSGNPTLANTNICNGVIGSEILPSLDSPKSFRKVPSSPALSKLDILSPSLHGSMVSLSCSSSTSPSPPEPESCYLTSMSSPSPVNEGLCFFSLPWNFKLRAVLQGKIGFKPFALRKTVGSFAPSMMDSMEEMLLISWLVLCMSPLCSIFSCLIAK